MVGAWLSLVEHLVRDQGVAGSNPVAPTIFCALPASGQAVAEGETATGEEGGGGHGRLAGWLDEAKAEGGGSGGDKEGVGDEGENGAGGTVLGDCG